MAFHCNELRVCGESRICELVKGLSLGDWVRWSTLPKLLNLQFNQIMIFDYNVLGGVNKIITQSLIFWGLLGCEVRRVVACLYVNITEVK